MEAFLPSKNDDLCLAAKTLHEDLQLNLAQIGQLILGIATLILLIITVWTYKGHKLALHYNFKLLMVNIIILYVFNSVAMIAIQLRYQIPLIFHFGACNFLTPVWLNLPLRLPSFAYVTAFVLFHLALTTERARATFLARRYEKEGSIYVWLCIVCVYILTILINGYMIFLATKDPTFLEKPVMHISITTSTNSDYLLYTYFFYLAIVIITAITDYILLYKNRKNRSQVEDYSLTRTYQINENIIVMKLLWPLDVCFAIVFAVYLSGTIYLRLIRIKLIFAHFMAHNAVITMILPMHAILTLLLYLHFVKHNKSRAASVVESGDHTQRHFEQLASQWMVSKKRCNDH
ncbi:serpentine type 7TM GPCR receptor class ab chemoreceptor domain-containing protein [Ditylenchus destructor]|uniref:Serpentine type 7TM GPCR receptor class ab chemoreceptor domain-containing protein n=1 Tax=Ditylenchus destructor TaxID=166010 RepID=A0AAD4MP02_9BILA|nr:serpentine type 7TM GPCR receptor class ab chemoreceptor domain-containing protein [Ditylenchus destructor]